ncbi:MAG TPA: flagellin [Rhodothermales bacterium]|nr:flagellin [Rhodothermales bacterium]
MSFGDLYRIRTNLQAIGSLNALRRTNSMLGIRQLRLATGKQINRAEDDSAGYTIAKKLQARVRGQEKALQNIGDAKSMLTVAEGSLNSIMDILQTMKEKTIQAANDTMGTTERDAIESELDALSAEITDILGATTFNGTSLFSSVGTSFTFQVNAENGDTFVASIATVGVGVSGMSVTDGDLVVTNATTSGETLARIDTAIETISSRLAAVGDSQKRLSFKQENLQTSIINYEAARSRIEDADFAKEQMEILKLQILQQTGMAALAQANLGPQSILLLFQRI